MSNAFRVVFDRGDRRDRKSRRKLKIKIKDVVIPLYLVYLDSKPTDKIEGEEDEN